jgi:hypothetical protein
VGGFASDFDSTSGECAVVYPCRQSYYGRWLALIFANTTSLAGSIATLFSPFLSAAEGALFATFHTSIQYVGINYWDWSVRWKRAVASVSAFRELDATAFTIMGVVILDSFCHLFIKIEGHAGILGARMVADKETGKIVDSKVSRKSSRNGRKASGPDVTSLSSLRFRFVAFECRWYEEFRNEQTEKD